VVEERLPEYEQLRQRLGIRDESVWFARTKAGETVIAYLEVEAPEWIASALATMCGSRSGSWSSMATLSYMPPGERPPS
jgi:hypothetical protein